MVVRKDVLTILIAVAILALLIIIVMQGFQALPGG